MKIWMLEMGLRAQLHKCVHLALTWPCRCGTCADNSDRRGPDFVATGWLVGNMAWHGTAIGVWLTAFPWLSSFPFLLDRHTKLLSEVAGSTFHMHAETEV